MFAPESIDRLARRLDEAHRTKTPSMDTSHSPFLAVPEAPSKRLPKLATWSRLHRQFVMPGQARPVRAMSRP